MLIEIKGAYGTAYLVDPERLVVPRPGSRAARLWFERGPTSAAVEASAPLTVRPDEAAAWERARLPHDRPSPAMARKAWVVIPGGP